MNPTTTSMTSQPLPQSALRTFAGAIETGLAQRFPAAERPRVTFEAPRRPEFGDFSTNVALGYAKIARSAPQPLAQAIIDDAYARQPQLRELFSSIEATAGFINARLAPPVWHASLAHILRQGERFGQTGERSGRISLEFGSANPTGPLVVVQGRALAIGGTLVNAMRCCGYEVFVEWIVNDAGSQIDALGRSLYARYRQCFDAQYPFPDDGYPGDYLHPIAASIAQTDGERWVEAQQGEWLAHFSRVGRDAIVAQQQATAQRFGIVYDLWQSEAELHDTGRVTAVLEHLTRLGLTYERDGAVYFTSMQFGDDKDRVLVRSDGRPTYYCPDIAYHYEKLQRAERVIDILGPDHHGYIGRLRAMAAALGYDGHLDVLIAQHVAILRDGEPVGMSKRAGQIVTLDEVLDEVGIDAARFFFTMLAPEQPLTFDLALALQTNNDNPVYYVQYGHARIASIFKRAQAGDRSLLQELTDAPLGRLETALAALTSPAELSLARRLAEFPQVVLGVVDALAPHRLARYARDVAADFHTFYTECRVLDEDASIRIARLALCGATQTILARTLGLLGVSAPQTM
ncbi:MAG: arginine--tRNA ligase [Vulcanimicrobiaceae bacterium]